MLDNNYGQELRESEQARLLAIWNLILSGGTLASLLFIPKDRIGVGIGLTLIVLWNLAALYDRKQRLRAAAGKDKLRDNAKGSG
jgi:hypothetical protein